MVYDIRSASLSRKFWLSPKQPSRSCCYSATFPVVVRMVYDISASLSRKFWLSPKQPSRSCCYSATFPVVIRMVYDIRSASLSRKFWLSPKLQFWTVPPLRPKRLTSFRASHVHSGRRNVQSTCIKGSILTGTNDIIAYLSR